MSGLSASMWTSVSGLMVHGNKMNVVGNNLANVSTLGFKSQRADFCDYLYVGAGSVSGNTQIGQGAATYALIGDFSQGSFESTNSVTDIAIDGNGFFKVRKPNSENMFYSRAGDFYFNADRELQNPEGYLLQGWKVNNRKTISFNNGSTNLGTDKTSKTAFVGTGSPIDIVLDSWNIIPQQTTNVTVVMGLTNSSDSDHTTDEDDPMTALFRQWNAKNDPPMPDTAYAAQSSLKVYDEGGTTHELTIYYDKVNESTVDSNGDTSSFIDGLPAGYTLYEYVVTMPPSEDKRSYGGEYNPVDGTLSDTTVPFYSSNPDNIKRTAGILMTGHLIFNGSGELVNQTAYTYAAQDRNLVNADGTVVDDSSNKQSALDPEDLKSWQPTKFSNNGLPTFAPNFSGLPLANSVSETMLKQGSTTPYSQVQDYVIELDLGLKNLGMNWNTDYDESTAGSPPSLAALAAVEQSHTRADGTTYTSKDAPYSYLSLMSNPNRQEYASAANSVTPTVQDATQDGYASGVLNNVNIDANGVVYGMYSNGKSLPLYQIALYDFKCEQGLYREGGNLFSATVASGDPKQGVPGDNGFGSTRAYNIEQSNVDMAKEFVQMITTQRGFQANSKAITTTDSMLETVIGMKR